MGVKKEEAPSFPVPDELVLDRSRERGNAYGPFLAVGTGGLIGPPHLSFHQELAEKAAFQSKASARFVEVVAH